MANSIIINIATFKCESVKLKILTSLPHFKIYS